MKQYINSLALAQWLALHMPYDYIVTHYHMLTIYYELVSSITVCPMLYKSLQHPSLLSLI